MEMMKLVLHSFSDWNDRIAPLIQLLDSQSTFRPNKWGPYEPARYRFDVKDIPRMEQRWKKYTGFELSQDRPKVDIMLVRSVRPDRTNWLAVHLEATYFQSANHTNQFLAFASELATWGDVSHGYACLELEFEQTNVLPRPTLINNKLIKTGGMGLRNCLPGVYWLNYFGPLYVDWFGRERFRDLPCYEQRVLPNGGILVLMADSPLSYNGTDKLKTATRQHLGADAFFDINNPTRPCRSPYRDGTFTITH